MKVSKRLLSLVLAVIMIVGMIPISTLTANAASWDLKSGGKVYAGEVGTITCYGGAAYQQTNVWFQADYPTMGYVTRYDKNGQQVSQRQICGSADFYDICVTGGETYVVETYVGAIEITYNTANTLNPKIDVVDGGINMEPIVKTNIYPSYELYLSPGETSDLFIQWYYPGCYFELNPQSSYNSAYVSENTSIVSIDDEGKVIAHKEGETRLKIYFKFGFSSEKYFSTYVETIVHVVDDTVDKQTGIRYFYSHTPIEVGDTVQIGADYTGGDCTGMYYPGTFEWKVDNENIISFVQPIENIAMIRAEALNIGECNLTLLLNGKEICTEKIEVTISDDTLIKLYKDYLTNCGVMATLDGARATCQEIIGRYSQSDITRIAFFSCLKSGLGLSVITKEVVSKTGFTSSTYDDMVDESLDDLLKDLFSTNDKGFSDVTSSVKKKYKLVNSQWKIGSSDLEKVLADYNPSFSKEQIKALNKKVSDFYKQSFLMVNEGITVAELLSTVVFSVQYERDTIVTLMNTIAASPGGTGTDLYKGLERQLRKIDDLTGYAVSKYLNDKIVDKVKDLVKAGFFLTDEKGVPVLFDKGVWSVAEGIGYIVSQVYGADGGIFSDDYMKACIASNFAATMYNVVINSNSATDLEYGFKFYVSSVKNALKAAIGISEDPYVYCLDLKRDAEGYLAQIDQTCTYETLLQQCRLAITNFNNCRSTVTVDENGEVVVSAYYVLPDQVDNTKRSLKSNSKKSSTNSFFDTGYTEEQLIIVPSHIDGKAVNTISDNGFKGITGKYGVLLPNSIVRIGDYAFSNCSDVRYVSLGSNLEYIGKGAFSACRNLQVINFPTSLKEIDASAFEDCSNLTTININAKYVNSKAFANCNSLTSVTIAKDTIIASDAFDNCSNSLVVYGYKGSAAETMANEYGFTFVDLSKEVVSVKIQTPANKTEFVVGEDFTTDGLVLEVTYADGTTKPIEDGWIAYADTTSVGIHNAKIYYEEITVSYEITVISQTNLDIQLDSYHQDLIIGTGVYLHAKISELSDNLRIKWSSSNPQIASVDKNGYVEAYSKGTTNIKAEIIGTDVEATCSVTVGDSMNIIPSEGAYIFFSVPESGEYVFYSKGSTKTAYGYIYDVAGNQLVSASGTNFKIERRLNKGVIYALRTTSSSSNNNYSIYIQKKVPLEEINITNTKKVVIDKISGYPNEVKSIDLMFLPDNYIAEEYSFESADESIATVSDDKKITFKGIGTTTITVTTTNGITDSVVVETLDYPEVKKDETVTINNDDSDYKTNYYYFVPEEDGNYLLRVNTSKVSVTIYDENWNSLSIFNASYSSNIGFGQASMVAGQKYYIRLENVGAVPRTYSFNIIKRPIATSVSITYSGKLSGYTNETVQLGTQFGPENCVVESCTWSSEDETIATVSSSGLVKFIGVGSTTISVVSENGLNDSVVVTTRDKQEFVLDQVYDVSCKNAGESYWGIYTATESGTYVFLSMGSKDTLGYLYDADEKQLASNDDGGEGGNFRIEYEFEAGKTYLFKSKLYSQSATGDYSVKLFKYVDAQSVEIIAENETIEQYIGKTYQLSAKLIPDNSYPQTFTWVSNDPEIASVNENGLVSFLSVGTTTITVTSSNGLTDSIDVTTKMYPTVPETIEQDEVYYLYSGAEVKNCTTSFTAPTKGFYQVRITTTNNSSYKYSNIEIEYKNANYKAWYSTSRRNGSEYVREENEVLFIEAGNTCELTFICPENTLSTVSVFPAATPTELSLNTYSLEFTEGDYSKYISYTLSPNYTYGNVIYRSNDENVATVDNYGSVKPVNAGVTIISVDVEGTDLHAECSVTVNEIEKEKIPVNVQVNNLTVGYYYVIPETSGYYSFLFNNCSSLDIYDDHWNSLGWINGSYNMACKYLKAGRKYILEISGVYSDANGIITPVDALNGISLNKAIELNPDTERTYQITTDNTRTYFDHSSSTYTILDPSIAEVTTSYSRGNQTQWQNYYEATITVKGLKIGATTLTIITADGKSFEFPVVVSDYDHIYDGDTKELTLASDDTVTYRFCPTEAGNYTIEASGTQASKFTIYDSNMKYLDHVEYGHWTDGHYVSKQFDFESGKEYYIVFCADFLYDGDYTFSLHKTVFPTEVTLSQTTINGFVGEEIELSYQLFPTYSFAENVTWSSENDIIASVNNGVVKLNSVGSTRIIATTESGVHAVCSVSVEDIPSLELGTTNVEITNPGDTAVYSFVAPEAGTYVFYSTNSSRDTFGYLYDEDMNEIAADDDSGESNNFRIQFELSEGEQCYLKAKFLSSDAIGSFDVVLYKLVQAESISIKEGSELNAYKGTTVRLSPIFSPKNAIIENCTWTSDNENIATVDEYGYVTLVSEGTVTITATSDSGLTAQCFITVTGFVTISAGETKSALINNGGDHAYFSFTPEEDGYYAFYSNADGDTYGYIRDEDMNQLTSDDDSGNGNNFKVKYQMTAGTTYILDAKYYGSDRTGSFDVTIEKTKSITKLEIVSLPNKMEYVKGFVSGNLNYAGLKLRATWSDGSTSDWSYGDDYGWRIDDEYIAINDYDVNETGNVELVCGGASVTIELSIIENPVDHIELVSGTAKSYIENYNGYIAENDDGEYFRYYTDYPNDATIRIVYSDGTSTTAKVGESVNDYYISWGDNQYDKPWVVGTENESTVSYLGNTVTLPITVIENPVDRIEINSAPTREYIYGDTKYGYLYSNGEYEFYPTDLTGLSFTVYYTDGTSTTFTNDDIDEDGRINGYDYDIQHEYYPEIGDVPVTFEYLGKTANYTVMLKESPVASITVTKNPSKTEYDSNYSPIFDGTEITFEYKDGTIKTVTLSNDNTSYSTELVWSDDIFYHIDVDGYQLSIENYYDWETEEQYYNITYCGCSTKLDNIFTYTEKEVTDVQMVSFDRKSRDMTVSVRYADESVELLEVKNITAEGPMNYGKTDNGLLYYWIESEFNEDGSIIGNFEIQVFGQTLQVSADQRLIGDVNGDGEVTSKDVTILRRYFAEGWDVEIVEANSDIDCDGFVTTKDVTILRRYLAGGWDVVLE